MFINTEDALEKGKMLTAQQAKFLRGLQQKFRELAAQAIDKKQFNLGMMMSTKAQLCNEALSIKETSSCLNKILITRKI